MNIGKKWRRRWDSNPRALAGYPISSRARYDLFDTSPRLVVKENGGSAFRVRLVMTTSILLQTIFIL